MSDCFCKGMEEELMIIKSLILIMTAIPFALGAVWFGDYYETKEFCSLKQILKTKKISCTVFLAVYIAISLLIVFTYFYKENLFFSSLKYLIFEYALFLTAAIDFKQKKIPNSLILFIMAERIIFFIPEFIIYPDEIISLLISSFTGMFVCGMIMLICRVISRKGIGAGDVKLFAAAGFMTNLYGAVNILFYSLFIASLVSIFLLLFKRAKANSTVPMAPFIFFGTTFYIIFM